MNETIKPSVKKLIADSEDFKVVDTYCRDMFNKYCDQNPKHKDTWRGYKDFTVLDENNIQINYVFGGGEMEFDGKIFVNLNTNIIKD